MLDKIKEMRGFLMACRMTNYLLPEQVALLIVALDLLEQYIKASSEADVQFIEKAVEVFTNSKLIAREE